MGRPKRGKLPPFVPLYKATMKTPAWRATSQGAKALYVVLRWRYNRNLGNHVYVSTRVAAEELGSDKDSVCRWFHELEHYGFIVMISPGGAGANGMGKAPHWRLTEENYLGRAATRDFETWDGTKFESRRPSRQLRPVRKIGDTLSVKCGTVEYLNTSKQVGTVRKIGDIHGTTPVRKIGDITS
jgi:hypothetical protein